MNVYDRDGRVNFVDDNNVFVGYDMGQCCCEHADWFVSTSEEEDWDNPKSLVTDHDFDGYIFDTEYLQEGTSGNFEVGGFVRFRWVKQGYPDLFLHLFNVHNGYYGHGFEMRIAGELKVEGCL